MQGVGAALMDPATLSIISRAAATAVRPLSRSRARRAFPSNLWIQALSKAGEDEEIRRYLRKHLGEVHGFFADLLRRAQEAGGIPADRDPVGEAWVNLGIGLLRSVPARVGGVLTEDDFRRIGASRRAWLTGQPLVAPHQR